MKNKKLIIGIVILSIILLIFGPTKKLAGETVSWFPENNRIRINEYIDITVQPSSTADVTSWIVDIDIPDGWTVWDYAFSGGGGAERQAFCGQEGDILGCLAIVSGTSIIDDTLIVTFKAPSSPTNPVSFTGIFTTVATDLSKIEGTLPSFQLTFEQSCGSGNCVGLQTYVSGWGVCSTSGDDCGTCCECSSTGMETYDSTQDVDCSATICPSDGCNLGGCGTHIFSDYPTSVSNQCSGLKSCTSNICSPTCTSDTDNDNWAGTNPSYANCYDCNNNDADMNPGETEICNSNKDENCDGHSLIGIEGSGLDQYADMDCNQHIDWNEIKNYVVAWATGDIVTYGRLISWNDVKGIVIFWATGG